MKTRGYKEILLDHFKRFEAITTLDAIEMYGMTRLSAVIYNLKKDGYKFKDKWIKVENRQGKQVEVKAYVLEGWEARNDNN